MPKSMFPTIDPDKHLRDLLARAWNQIPGEYSTTWGVIRYLMNNIEGFMWLRNPTDAQCANTKRVKECAQMLEIVLDDPEWFRHPRILDDLHIKHMFSIDKCPFYTPPYQKRGRKEIILDRQKIGKVTYDT